MWQRRSTSGSTFVPRASRETQIHSRLLRLPHKRAKTKSHWCYPRQILASELYSANKLDKLHKRLPGISRISARSFRDEKIWCVAAAPLIAINPIVRRPQNGTEQASGLGPRRVWSRLGPRTPGTCPANSGPYREFLDPVRELHESYPTATPSQFGPIRILS